VHFDGLAVLLLVHGQLGGEQLLQRRDVAAEATGGEGHVLRHGEDLANVTRLDGEACAHPGVARDYHKVFASHSEDGAAIVVVRVEALLQRRLGRGLLLGSARERQRRGDRGHFCALAAWNS